MFIIETQGIAIRYQNPSEGIILLSAFKDEDVGLAGSFILANVEGNKPSMKLSMHGICISTAESLTISK